MIQVGKYVRTFEIRRKQSEKMKGRVAWNKGKRFPGRGGRPKSTPRIGGWQLDHTKSIRECFDQEWTPEEASNINNLQMLPWLVNLLKK